MRKCGLLMDMKFKGDGARKNFKKIYRRNLWDEKRSDFCSYIFVGKIQHISVHV